MSLERLLHSVAKHSYAGWEAIRNNRPHSAESSLVEALYAVALERPELLEEALKATKQARTQTSNEGW